jgi:hypothetical protein
MPCNVVNRFRSSAVQFGIFPVFYEEFCGLVKDFSSWVDLRAGLDDLEKRKFLALPGLELRRLGRPARPARS